MVTQLGRIVIKELKPKEFKMQNQTSESSFSDFLTDMQKTSNYYNAPLGVISVSYNLIVVVSAWMIVKSNVQAKSTYMILGNIAFVDTLLGVVLLILNHLIAENGWHTCAFVYGSLHWCIIEISFSMLLSAIDRYIYFTYGLYYQSWMTTRRTVYMLLATWVFSFLLGFLPVMIFYRSDTNCLYFSSTPSPVKMILVFTSCLSFVIKILLYVSIVITARKANMCAESDGRNVVKSFAKKSKVANENISRNISDCPANTEFQFVNEVQNNIEQTEINKIFCISLKQIDQEYCLPKLQYLYTTKTDQSTESLNKIRQFTENKTIRKNKQTDSFSTKEINNKINRKSKIIIVLITTTFIITWGPVLVFISIYSKFCSDKDYPIVSKDFCSILEKTLLLFEINFGLLSLLLTPVIYCWWHTPFRKSILKLCFKDAARGKRRRKLLTTLKK